jgi:hypothetical protein
MTDKRVLTIFAHVKLRFLYANPNKVEKYFNLFRKILFCNIVVNKQLKKIKEKPYEIFIKEGFFCFDCSFGILIYRAMGNCRAVI